MCCEEGVWWKGGEGWIGGKRGDRGGEGVGGRAPSEEMHDKQLPGSPGQVGLDPNIFANFFCQNLSLREKRYGTYFPFPSHFSWGHIITKQISRQFEHKQFRLNSNCARPHAD